MNQILQNFVLDSFRICIGFRYTAAYSDTAILYPYIIYNLSIFYGLFYDSNANNLKGFS